MVLIDVINGLYGSGESKVFLKNIDGNSKLQRVINFFIDKNGNLYAVGYEILDSD